MATAFVVHGPCQVNAYVGSANASALVGITEDGVRVSEQIVHRPVRADTAGEAPADYQMMGMSADITGTFSVYDDAVVDSCKARSQGGATAGTVATGAVGALMGTGTNLAFALALTSAVKPYYFPTAFLADAQQLDPMGTRYSVWRLTFRAWVFVPATAVNANAIKLYQRTIPA